MAEPRTLVDILLGATAEPRAPEKWWLNGHGGRAACTRKTRRNEHGTSLLLILQEALELELLDKLLCLCLAAPDMSVKQCKPVPENLWGPVFQELHVWGAQQKQVVQSGASYLGLHRWKQVS